jgi:Ni/Co efflux regulator RcnB
MKHVTIPVLAVVLMAGSAPAALSQGLVGRTAERAVQRAEQQDDGLRRGAPASAPERSAPRPAPPARQPAPAVPARERAPAASAIPSPAPAVRSQDRDNPNGLRRGGSGRDISPPPGRGPGRGPGANDGRGGRDNDGRGPGWNDNGGRNPNWNDGRGQGYNNGRWRDRDRDRRRYERRYWDPFIRAPRAYDWYGPGWRTPPGYYSHSWRFGEVLPWSWYTPNYYLNDYWRYGLPMPPVGMEWVRVGRDALLVDIFNGRVYQVVNYLFW